ncbi:hypothetical protein E2C01_006514 [Portunus trituberculatus]|uniref:Secreted protein n=1 Tax=Portunus trituberculatus TaxID=210409 RepID=A0A5B7CY32_PORTR|nr:hypothetical protein [Portunus trituberculatus]
MGQHTFFCAGFCAAFTQTAQLGSCPSSCLLATLCCFIQLCPHLQGAAQGSKDHLCVVHLLKATHSRHTQPPAQGVVLYQHLNHTAVPGERRAKRHAFLRRVLRRQRAEYARRDKASLVGAARMPLPFTASDHSFPMSTE